MSDPEIAKFFVNATINIMQTMAGMSPLPGPVYVKTNANTFKGDVSAIVGVTGAKRGTIAVSFNKASAIELVRGMLGDDIQDVLSDMQDAVGELVNMISGQARAALAEHGIVMQGSTPSVILGSSHLVHHANTAQVVAVPFKTEAGEFTVEFCFT